METEETIMHYALLSDLHSDYKNTKAVLKHIQQIAPHATIIGLGDLYECIIGKRKAAALKAHVPLEEAAIIKKKFTKLLTFPSIIGNQEERIALVTGRKEFLDYPDKIIIDHATLMHGHQFEIDEHYDVTFPPYETQLLFFGHSHRAALYINGIRTKVEYNKPIEVGNQKYEINVGAVVESRDWCLYDSEQMTVTFLQAQKNDSSD